MSETTLKLEDFLPGYSHFDEEYSDDLFNLYGNNPDISFYEKKEFYENRLERSEKKPDKPGTPLKNQLNTARFLSPNTLNDEILLFDGLGSGKCVHGLTRVSINGRYLSMVDIWKKFSTTTFLTATRETCSPSPKIQNIKLSTEGEWSVPSKDMIVMSTDKRKIVLSKVSNLYRQWVREELFSVILENGCKLVCTGKHLLLSSENNWVYTSSVSIGQKIKTFIPRKCNTDYDSLNGNNGYTSQKSYCSCIQLQSSPVVSVERTRYEGYVYDLEIENLHNYVAEGIVTHNTCTSITIAEHGRRINPSLKRTLVLVKGPPLRRNFIQELAFRCTGGKFIPDNYNTLTKGEKVVRMNRLINREYEIETFETFADKVSKYSLEYIEKVYSNRVIIIDEVHNIRIQPKKKKGDSVNVYDSIHRFLHHLSNRKIVLLSATPMRDRPEEFGSVMNLILPVDKQLPTGKEFVNKFFNSDQENHDLKNVQELRDSIRGRVGYIRSMEGGVLKVFKGELIGKMKKIKVFSSQMSRFQTDAYTKAYTTDKGENNDIIDVEENDDGQSHGLYAKSRQASLFVFPDGSSGGSSKKDEMDIKEGFGEYFTESGTKYIMSTSLKNELTDNGKASPMKIVKNISKYSSIYASTIKEILEHPDENTFVYNKYVQGSGAILFAELLKLVGFEQTRGYINIDTNTEDSINERSDDEVIDEMDDEVNDEMSEKKVKKVRFRESSSHRYIRNKPRFSLITGDGVSGVEIDRVIDKIFNDPRNKHGKYIQVIIGSQVIGEGKSLKNVRQIHIQTPHWNNPETEQAIGRGIRAFSHDDLDPDKRTVKIFRHASIPIGGIESINYLMYKISEDKDFKMKRIERLCKEEAVNCPLNWERNNLPTDVDGSKECDYMKCEYKCSHVSRDDIDNPLIERDTYNLFYAEEEINRISSVIKQIFKKRFFIDLEELKMEFSETSMMIIVRALKKMIDTSTVLVNRYGFPCYLREDHNLYFLVDDISLPNSFLLSRYCENPNVKKYYLFEDIIKLAQYRYIVEDKTYLIENLSDEDDKREIIKQIHSLSPLLQEMFIEMAISGNKMGVSKGRETRNLVIDSYKNYIIKLKDKTVSTLLQDEEGRFRCISDSKNTLEDWEDCDESVVDELEDVKLEEKVSLEMNPYKYYGRILKDSKKKFKFVIKKIKKNEVFTKEGKKDGRSDLRGTTCQEIVPKQRIIDIITDLNKKKINIKPPIEIIMKNREKFIDEIIQKNTHFKKEALVDMSDEELKSVYYWNVKAGKKEMCDSIEQWFKDNNLMEYEK